MKPNARQQELIDSLEGIFLVDAGPGTGKTSTLVRRYGNLLSKVSPQDILLITFTNNAAQNMRSKIINSCAGKYNAQDLMDAPISTFHAFCNRLLRAKGFSAPKHLGIDQRLPKTFALVENEILEEHMFRSFLRRFRRRHADRYKDIFIVLEDNDSSILAMIRKLCCKGIFPTREGWFSNGYDLLLGDLEGYRKRFDELNAAQQGSAGERNSRLLTTLRAKLEPHNYLDCPPEEEIFRGKQISQKVCDMAFDDDRHELVSFLHDVYLGYVIYMLRSNRLNFDFMIMLAFVLLYNDTQLRRQSAFEYVMVDEFQDTNEVQFKLIMLLMRKGNLCVVGDWKQGIYGFRNATIENILDFPEKIASYRALLNKDEERICYDVSDIRVIALTTNYRSSQRILDLSERSLLIKASVSEEIDAQTISESIVHLDAQFDLDTDTDIRFYRADKPEDEIQLILSKIQEIVHNDSFMIKEYDSVSSEYRKRHIRYSDIAVLSRTKTFGLGLQKAGLNVGIPINYEGGIELFRTEGSILILAWLRLLLDIDSVEGWIPILEKEGYTYPEKKKMLSAKSYPKNLLEFRQALVRFEKNMEMLIDRILGFYGLADSYANALVSELSHLFTGSSVSVPDLMHFIEQNISICRTYHIDISTGCQAVTVQTIHGAKGLEYPVVFIADCNTAHFPSTKADTDILIYNSTTGIRFRKTLGTKNGYRLVFGNWRTDIVCARMSADLDEERRLLYVAMTRAKQYLFFTAGARQSLFFDNMADIVIDDYPKSVRTTQAQNAAEESKIEIAPGYKKPCKAITVHDLMDIIPSAKGRGLEFGSMVHDYAHRLAIGIDKQCSEPACQNIRLFIAQLGAKQLIPEIECAYPIGRAALVRGIIDLIAVFDDHIDIIDYKTDIDDTNESEYIKQISVYYHVMAVCYPGLHVRCRLFYATQGRTKDMIPLSLTDIEKIMSEKGFIA